MVQRKHYSHRVDVGRTAIVAGFFIVDFDLQVRISSIIVFRISVSSFMKSSFKVLLNSCQLAPYR